MNDHRNRWRWSDYAIAGGFNLRFFGTLYGPDVPSSRVMVTMPTPNVDTVIGTLVLSPAS